VGRQGGSGRLAVLSQIAPSELAEVVGLIVGGPMRIEQAGQLEDIAAFEQRVSELQVGGEVRDARLGFVETSLFLGPARMFVLVLLAPQGFLQA
jgi:hypothetical protein